MRFKLDENLPTELAEDLIPLGHEADTVGDEGLCGSVDEEVVVAAGLAQRVLLTLDVGIADLRRNPAGAHAGIVLFRPGRTGRRSVLDFVRGRLPVLLAANLAGKLTVVGATRIRTR